MTHVLKVPIKYLIKEASDQDKEVLEMLIESVKNNSVVVLPSCSDAHGNRMFDLEWLPDGKNNIIVHGEE